MSMPASPELSGSVKRISAMPPPKMVWKASEKLLLMAWEGVLELFLGGEVRVRRWPAECPQSTATGRHAHASGT